MMRSELHKIIEQWLEDPKNPENEKKLEAKLSSSKEALNAFRMMTGDFRKSVSQNEIAENPFFFSKLKYRMESPKGVKQPVRQVQWAVYAATLSLSIMFGVVLGNQVQSTPTQTSSATQTIEETYADEFLVADYNIDDTILIELVDN